MKRMIVGRILCMGVLIVVLNDKTTESFSFLIIFVIFVPIIN